MNADPAPAASDGPGARARRVLTLAWVPLVASLVSLVLSIGSIVIATRDPAVVVLIPDQIRFVQGEGLGLAYAYFQPTFVSTGNNERVEVIREMRLIVTPLDGGEPAQFAWDEVGAFDFATDDDSLDYRYVGDAVPLLVAPDSAENPLALFEGPDGWLLEAGRHRIELVADRVVAADPLRATFEIELSDEDIAFLADADGTQFLAIPIADDR